jgi:hypothetical protein
MPVDKENFRSVSDRLKSLITEPTFDVREMRVTPYLQQNTFNVIITTNNDAVSFTQANNSRYIVTDVDESLSAKTEENRKYFVEINKLTADKKIQLAFFCMMKQRYTDKNLKDWNEDDLADSKTRKQKIIEGLPRLHKYLKETFILKSKNLDKKTDVFLNDYLTATKDPTSKNKIGRMLTKLGITPKKINKDSVQYYKYVISHEDLLNTFKTNGWFDEEVDLIQKDGEIDEEEYDHGVEKKDQSVKLSIDEQMVFYKQKLDELHKLKMKELQNNSKPEKVNPLMNLKIDNAPIRKIEKDNKGKDRDIIDKGQAVNESLEFETFDAFFD